MPGSLRTFWLTLLIGGAAACASGIVYARFLGIPPGIAGPVLAAFLLEFVFYLVPGFEAARSALARGLRPPVLSLAMALSGIVPYCSYSLSVPSKGLPGSLFSPLALFLVVGIAAAVSFWYVLLPRHAATDSGFLILLAAVAFSKIFSRIYASPMPHLHIEVLGQLMLIRLGAMAVLAIRNTDLSRKNADLGPRTDGIVFGFIPDAHEWSVGIRHFLFFLPVAYLLSLCFHFAAWHPPAMAWWRAAPLALATFLGMLWVVALSEEFFFRGLLQQWLTAWMRSPTAGLAAASLLFGLAHLWFRSFPNWKFAILAGVAGCFYGRAYQKAGGIRAPMVTHALVVTTWKVFFW
jgi:membrane protease YdiL (CAAX protease family)